MPNSIVVKLLMLCKSGLRGKAVLHLVFDPWIIGVNFLCAFTSFLFLFVYSD